VKVNVWLLACCLVSHIYLQTLSLIILVGISRFDKYKRDGISVFCSMIMNMMLAGRGNLQLNM
jgi:hypothetical protein